MTVFCKIFDGNSDGKGCVKISLVEIKVCNIWQTKQSVKKIHADFLTLWHFSKLIATDIVNAITSVTVVMTTNKKFLAEKIYDEILWPSFRRTRPFSPQLWRTLRSQKKHWLGWYSYCDGLFLTNSIEILLFSFENSVTIVEN